MSLEAHPRVRPALDHEVAAFQNDAQRFVWTEFELVQRNAVVPQRENPYAKEYRDVQEQEAQPRRLEFFCFAGEQRVP